MAGNYRGIVTFAWHALLGALAGVLFGTLAGGVIGKLVPARFEAAVVLFHTPGSGLSDSGRDFVAATLARPDFLTGVAARLGSDATGAADLARTIEVAADDPSRPIAEMRLRGTDETTLASTLDAVAEQMVALHRERQKAALQWQLDALDEILETATRRRRDLDSAQHDRATLPESATAAIAAAAKLARQRREIELSGRYRLRLRSALEDRRRELSLNALVRQQERAQRALDEHSDIDRAHIERARAVAIADAEMLALQQTRNRLKREFDSFTPLQIVRPAEVGPLANAETPMLMLAALGGLIGLLAGGLVWSWRQSSPGKQTAAAVKKSLRVPVLAVMAESLTEPGDGDRRPLAETNPEHLAVAGIRSLRVALHVLVRGSDTPAPVVIAGFGDPRHASLVVANLAVVAAQAGERVLIVEDAGDDAVLPAMFAGETVLSTAIHADEPSRESTHDTRFGTGRIRFLIGDPAGSGSGAAVTSIAREITGDFDRVFVHVQDTARARGVLKDFGAGIGLLVCASEHPSSALRKAGANKLSGVVLCGYPIDEPTYGGG